MIDKTQPPEPIKCDICGTTEQADYYVWPVQDEDGNEPNGIELCPDHAIQTGFCPLCGYFVLGSGDERGMVKNGCCTGCFDEFHSDWDDSDFSDEEWIIG